MNEPPPKPRFELRHTQGVEVPTEELLADLNRAATVTGRRTVTYREYKSLGRYSPVTVKLRFGSWNKALKQAGFGVSNELRIDRDRLFENLERLWIILGRQPTKRDLGTKQSEFSYGPYDRVFGSWRKALEEFVNWANADDVSSLRSETATGIGDERNPSKATPRDPNLRTRFLVMRRDGFRCRYCGKSPANHAGVELVLDHARPWSKGGETIMDNLVTSCVACNTGKSNII